MWFPPGLEDRFLHLLGAAHYRLLARLYSKFSLLTDDFWEDRNGTRMMFPITTGSVSSPIGLGSDSEPVQASVNGFQFYLADSMQFSLEYGCRLTDGAAYYISPSFRGENQDSTHLSEFFHSEAEIHGGLDDVIETVEAYVRFLTAGLSLEFGDELEALGISTSHFAELAERAGPFPRITFDQAVDMLDCNPEFVEKVENADARRLTRRGELALIEQHGGVVWVTGYDAFAVPFYQAWFDQTKATALNGDLLFGVGEVVGAGERHGTVAALAEALARHNLSETDYRWYLKMKEVYPARTAGFGLGIERYFAWFLGCHDIRDLQLLPRQFGTYYAP